MSRTVSTRAVLVGTVLLALSGVLASCASDDATDSTSASVSESSSASGTASATPTDSASAPATDSTTSGVDDITLPGSCEAIYSSTMLQTLQSTTPPLNDPDVTVTSTKLVPALEVLDAAPNVRCTWGEAGHSGIATTVAVVDSEQSATVLSALESNGFDCHDSDGGTLCTADSTGVDIDSGDIVSQGESHFLRGNGWVATTWITVNPDGYTQDIAATVWG